MKPTLKNHAAVRACINDFDGFEANFRKKNPSLAEA